MKTIFSILIAIAYIGLPLVLFRETMDVPFAVSTPLLGVGAVLWAALTARIFTVAYSRPAKYHKQISRIQQTGVPVSARIVHQQHVAGFGSVVRKKLTVRFTNLAGSVVDGEIKVTDTSPHQGRYEIGQTLPLLLNREGTNPAYILAEQQPKNSKVFFGLLWTIFNIAYAIGLFLATYYFRGAESVTDFLAVDDPWVWGAILIGLLLWDWQDDSSEKYRRDGATLTDEEYGELMLYGVPASGEIVNYVQSPAKVTRQEFDNQSYVDIYVRYVAGGQPVDQMYTKRIPNVELHELQRGPVEVIYLPHRPDLYQVNIRA
ncbi:MAG: hypothetical protein WBH82_03535 [Arcanobacterium sp.]